MQLVSEDLAPRHFTSAPRDQSLIPANPGAAETNLGEMRIGKLRQAIHRNQVSFPSQVPTFPKHDRPDLQSKLVQLYFVFGWSAQRIAERYGLSRSRAQQILNTWRRRAVEAGYVQAVPPAEKCMPSSTHAPGWVVLSQVLDHSAVSHHVAPSAVVVG
jgi:hypothetical protein